MNWEQTIQFIRTKPEFKDLVEKAYFEEDLVLNVERFRKSEEFIETLIYLNKFSKKGKTVLDIGSGNGISAIAFALEGYTVKCIEPDPSETIGAGAIRILKDYYRLENLEVFESFAEDIKFPDNSFDVVYARQCMHHANDLNKFILESSRVLKKGGMFFTVRDHVIYNSEDKKWFLNSHPLQQYYGGENAFTEAEYINAIKVSGLKIKEVLRHFDNVINYFPLTRANKKIEENYYRLQLKNTVKKYYGVYSFVNFYSDRLIKKIEHIVDNPHDESKIPGRMYSFIALKDK
jgi:SAM-dependent methyltransferase